MEKKIENLLMLLKMEFVVAIVIIIALITGYEYGILEEGTLVGSYVIAYFQSFTDPIYKKS